MNNMVIQGYTKLLGVRAQMCGWIKKKPSTQGAVWPFYSAVNNQRYSLAGGLPDGNLHTDHMHFQLKRYS